MMKVVAAAVVALALVSSSVAFADGPPQSHTTTYIYNALGRRIGTSGSGTAYYMYDEAGHLLGEHTGTGGLTQETIYPGDIPVATHRPSGSTSDIFYVHWDHLNSPRVVTRGLGVLGLGCGAISGLVFWYVAMKSRA